MPVKYTETARSLQDKHGTTKIADRLVEFTQPEFSDEDIELITAARMFFIASVDADGAPQVSYKGGAPGFVKILSGDTFAFPFYNGNGMFLSAANVVDTGKAAFLFIDFESPYRLRVNGEARLSDDPEMLGQFPEAEYVVVVKATEIFGNCSRYIHKMQFIEQSKHVPTPGKETAVATWKFLEEVQDVLTDTDRKIVRDKVEGGEATIKPIDMSRRMRDQI